jgi:hypothetical protein
MLDTGKTLQTLDNLLEAWDLLDFDSTLLQVEEGKRDALKREAEMQNILQKVSLDTLRKNSLVELIKEYRQGCVQYLYSLVRVHASSELSYHELLCEICAVRRPNIYDGDKIREYWDDWWSKNGNATKYATLRWQHDSPTLDAALQALTCSSDLIAPFVTHSHTLVRESVARRTDLDMETQWELAEDPAPIVRYELATNRNTSPDILAELANDLNSIVRRWVASHPATPDLVLNRLQHDPIEGVRKFLDQRRQRETG